MRDRANNEKAGAASTAAGPLNTEFVQPVSADNLNEDQSLEESSKEDDSCFPDPITAEQMATDYTASALSLDVWKAEGTLLPEEPIPSMSPVPNPSASIAGSRQNPDWKQLVQSGIIGPVRWDEFILTNTIKINGVCVVLDQIEITRLINECEALGYSKIPFKEFEKHLELIARNNKFDSAKEWLLNLPKSDGKERVKHFLSDYLGTGISPYFEAVGLYLWTAMVARLLEPGCQVDMVPVIVGRQGLGKTSFLRTIAPNPAYCVEACLTDSPSQLARKLVGKTVVVWEELAGIKGRVDADRVKTFITNPYVELSSFTKAGMDRFDRRFVIFGTSNRKDFLRDVTGNRRYLPFESYWIDLVKLQHDKDQLWAEALEIVKTRQLAGQPIVAYEDAERLAEAEFEEFTHQARWYGDPSLHRFLVGGADQFSTEEALDALSVHTIKGKLDRNEMSNTLRQLGYKYGKGKSLPDGRKPKVWHRPKTPRTIPPQCNTTIAVP